MEFQYKKQNPNAEQRKNECISITKQFPDKIPIICEKDPKSKMTELSKTKYLIHKEFTAGQLIFIIRKQITLEEKYAFFLFVGERRTITSDTLLFDLYERYKDPEDGFLYINYSEEQVWG